MRIAFLSARFIAIDVDDDVDAIEQQRTTANLL